MTGASKTKKSPRVLPRVGDEYQIEIPSLMSRSKYISENKNKFIENAVDLELASEDFSDKIQNESLLLGLCIFGEKGKDFTEIRKFLGYEPASDIISFYYRNEFYKSNERRIWKDCKKAERSKVILGKMIFKGCRLEELLYRLSAHVTKEDEKLISKACKLFKNGKMTLLEFVSTIKDVTGMEKFVEAMAIGKGESDLTRMIEPARKKKKKKLNLRRRKMGNWSWNWKTFCKSSSSEPAKKLNLRRRKRGNWSWKTFCKSSYSEPAKKRQKILIEEPPPPLLLFDLNYPPPLPPCLDPYEIFVTNEEEGGLDCNEPNKSSDEKEEQKEQPAAMAVANGGGRRKSSRNSLPTARVKEALADGYLRTAGRSTS